MASFPTELVLRVFEESQDDLQTLCNISLLSRRVHSLTTPLLYRSIKLSRRSAALLDHIFTADDKKATYVQEITLLHSLFDIPATGTEDDFEEELEELTEQVKRFFERCLNLRYLDVNCDLDCLLYGWGPIEALKPLSHLEHLSTLAYTFTQSRLPSSFFDILPALPHVNTFHISGHKIRWDFSEKMHPASVLPSLRTLVFEGEGRYREDCLRIWNAVEGVRDFRIASISMKQLIKLFKFDWERLETVSMSIKGSQVEHFDATLRPPRPSGQNFSKRSQTKSTLVLNIEMSIPLDIADVPRLVQPIVDSCEACATVIKAAAIEDVTVQLSIHDSSQIDYPEFYCQVKKQLETCLDVCEQYKKGHLVDLSTSLAQMEALTADVFELNQCSSQQMGLGQLLSQKLQDDYLKVNVGEAIDCKTVVKVDCPGVDEIRDLFTAAAKRLGLKR